MYCVTYKCTTNKESCIKRQIKNRKYFTQDWGCAKCKIGQDLYNLWKEGKITMTKNKTKIPAKICSKCRNTKPLDNFYADAGSPDKKSYWCKDCTRKRQIDLAKEKKAIKKEKTAASKYVENQAKVILSIDFTNHQDVYQRLITSAKEEFRSPEMQALYFLYKKQPDVKEV